MPSSSFKDYKEQESAGQLFESMETEVTGFDFHSSAFKCLGEVFVDLEGKR